MRALIFGVFEHPEITSPMYEYQRVAYMQRILRGAALKNYRVVLTECNKSVK